MATGEAPVADPAAGNLDANYDATVEALRKAEAPKLPEQSMEGRIDYYGPIPDPTPSTPPVQPERTVPAVALVHETRKADTAQAEYEALAAELQAAGWSIAEDGTALP